MPQARWRWRPPAIDAHRAFAQATIKIGAVLSVTGPASFLGDPEKKTLKMYVDDINAKGGIAGKKIELVIYDDGGDAEQGAHLRHPPDRGGQGRRDGRRLDHRHHDGDDPGVRGGANSVHLVRRRGAGSSIRCKKWVFKTPHTD